MKNLDAKNFFLSPQVAFEITDSNKTCIVKFPTPKEVWTHYVLTYSTLDNTDGIDVFTNGEQVTNFAFKECSDGSFDEENVTRISIGEHSHGVNLPEAAFDEVIIWYKNLAKEDINTMYSYYKGKVIECCINFGLAWFGVFQRGFEIALFCFE